MASGGFSSLRAGGVNRGRLRVGCGACRTGRSIAWLRPASGVGSWPARPDREASAGIAPWCLSCCRDCRSVPPNQSFKPTLLRSTKPMAGRACHGFGSATQRGLTQSLDRCLFVVRPDSRVHIAKRLPLAGREVLGGDFRVASVDWQAAKQLFQRLQFAHRALHRENCFNQCDHLWPRGLTIHSSRHRFAARLNSGVRPYMRHHG